MKKMLITSCAVALNGALVFAQSNTSLVVTAVETSMAPVVTSVTDTTAKVSISPALLGGALSQEELAQGYFEYSDVKQVCIMIYPTPEYCLPKKTSLGSTAVTLTNLKPGTTYTIAYKRDNTIRCITTPCPENGYESPSRLFTTPLKGAMDTPDHSGSGSFMRNLYLGSRGADVTLLQQILIDKGYLKASATGYFGAMTHKAVKEYQKANNVSAPGHVGPLTRSLLNKKENRKNDKSTTERFEGTVTAYSTACFADGICSISVDGKTVVTTRGWSQDIVGKVLGIPDFGSIEQKLGAKAKVYAAKTEDGYTLYGDEKYYIEIISENKDTSSSKAGKNQTTTTSQTSQTSVTSSNGSTLVKEDFPPLSDTTWEWQKTVKSDGGVITPNRSGVFIITFGANGRLSGKTDCNSYFGNYTQRENGYVRFSSLGSTLMYCEGSQESLLAKALEDVDRFDSPASTTIILRSGFGSTYLFRK